MKKRAERDQKSRGKKEKKFPSLSRFSLHYQFCTTQKHTDTQTHLKGDIREETERKKGLSLLSLSLSRFRFFLVVVAAAAAEK
jgi:hypothetical protein